MVPLFRRILDEQSACENVKRSWSRASNEQLLWRSTHRYYTCQRQLSSTHVGYHNRLNRRMERAHSNMWSFIRCIVSEESRFQHVNVQPNTGVQRRPKATCTCSTQKRKKRSMNDTKRKKSMLTIYWTDCLFWSRRKNELIKRKIPLESSRSRSLFMSICISNAF